MQYKLVVFDMDGTLVKEDSCWELIHRHFGVQKASSENLKTWKNREIDYPEFMRRDIALWNPTPHISKIKEILKDYRLPPKAQETMQEIQNRGYETAIISGGLDILAEMVAQELNIPHVFANGLETNEEGYLTGEGIFRVDPHRKSRNLDYLTKELGIKKDECVSVGDSVYDTDLFTESGMGIAIGDSEQASKSADIIIEDFEDFSQILNYL